MNKSGHSLHLLTGCQAYAALCDKLFDRGEAIGVDGTVFFRTSKVWVATILTFKISVRGEGPTMDAACQDAVNKYIYEQAS